MVDLIICEFMKLRRARMVIISIMGALAAPLMMFLEALQNKFEHPGDTISLTDFYDSSLIYIMLLMNMMLYIVIAAHLFSREYSEGTLKSILTIPVSRRSFIISKFCVLFLWIMTLTLITWAGILIFAGLYNIIYEVEDYSFAAALFWLAKLLMAGILMFMTTLPFAYLAEKTRGLVAPMITASAVIMVSAALSNQEIGAIYPWTATYFLLKGKLLTSGYPVWLSLIIIAGVSVMGFFAAIRHLKREDIK